MFRILVTEDDKNSARFLQITLTRAGYSVLSASNGKQAIEVLDSQHVDLIVLDIMMPEMNGYEFAETIRSHGIDIPILVISAKQLPEDKCKAFLTGADDYMTKPVNDQELLLRIKALMRRAKISEEKLITVGSTKLIYDSLTVNCNGKDMVLPKKEFQILFKLLSFPNKTFTRANIMDEFWEMDSDSEIRTVDVHINRLQERFRENEDFEIVTVRGLGYKAVLK